MQGSGKGTQARLFLEFNLSYQYFSVGDILRERGKSGDALGKEIESYMHQGLLVPDDIIFGVLAHFLKDRLNSQDPIIFDGFPRTIQQFHLLEKILDDHGRKYCCLYYDISFGETMRRIQLRTMSGNLTRSVREDDKDMKIIMKRLEAFFQYTFPILSEAFLEERLIIVDAMPEPKTIFQKVCEDLKVMDQRK